MVVAQVAMALVLMVCASLMIRTFASLRNVDPGYADADHVETMSISIPDQMVTDAKAVSQVQNQILDKLAAIPGVDSAGYAAAVPMDGNDPNWDTIAVEYKKYDRSGGPLRLFNYISPAYFHTLGTRIVAGRDFTWDDLENVRPFVIVSEGFARENWGSAGAAIGKRLKKYQNSPWQQVVGVVEDVHVHGVDEKAAPMVYWPAMFYDRYSSVHEMGGLRTVTYAMHTPRAGTQSLLTEMQRAVWSVSRDLPLASVVTMQQLYTHSMARTSFTLVMLGIAASMALALGIVGIYGIISYAVAQRTREIGIRLALGAQKNAVRWMFVRSALALTGIGVVLGLGAAGVIAQLLRSLLFGISPFDPLSFTAVPLVLGAAAAVASFLPALRVSAINPVDALRAE
jgi:predicted permease